MKLSDDTFGKIPWARPSIDAAERQAVIDCMDSGWLSSGPRVERFEHALAERAGRKYGVAVSNGTAALDVALRALGIGRGDRVIVPAFSYVATASAVSLQGATPVFADVDRRNLGLDPRCVEQLLARDVRAIICTDHGGSACDYARLTAIADRAGIPLLVDGAQSIGSTFAGRPTLGYGAVSTTSFHAAKTMTTVEGGMVFVDDPALARKLRILKSQGEDPDQKYHHIELGHNFRMTELQAAIGLAQLDKLDTMLAERERSATLYRNAFAAAGLQSPPGLADARSGQFLFSLLVPHRDEVVGRLRQRGIESRVCYPKPLYAQPIFQGLGFERCPVTEDACARIINPPLFFGLTPGQQQRVVSELLEAVTQLSQYRRAG